MILRRVFVWVFVSLGFLIKTLNFQFCVFVLGSSQRAPRLPKLLARKRVPRTNGRKLRLVCRAMRLVCRAKAIDHTDREKYMERDFE